MFLYPFKIVHSMFEGDHLSYFLLIVPLNINVLWGVFYKNISPNSFIVWVMKNSSTSSSPLEDEVESYSKPLLVLLLSISYYTKKLIHNIK